ncbi:MAG: hypothetical protein MUF52_04710 [Syntrophobacteraceae bacterium]|nr:hypothetical protein [Syntrophobacteraceae bacterium]
MFSVGAFDWKNLGGSDSLLKDLGRARRGAIQSLASGLLGRAVGDGDGRGDLFKLSEPLRKLRQSGLDLERSYLKEASQQVDFSFSFQDEHVRALRADGLVDVRSQTLKMDFSFQSSMKTVDPVTGEEREELFQFEFHLEASQFQAQEGRSDVRKEDILGFARKILQKIGKMRADGQEIDGLALEREDLQDLGGVEGGRLLKQIGHLIDLVKSIDRLNGRQGPHEWVKPQREKAVVENEMDFEERSLNFSLRVTRLELSTSSTEAQPAEATPASNPGPAPATGESAAAP